MSILKRVPDKTTYSHIDARRQFFIDNANSEKYYYMPVGDNQGDRNRNTLVPLGTFLGFIDYRPAPGGYGRIQVMDGINWTEYYMRFSNPPYNSENEHGPIHMSVHPLVYTDHPPAAGSVPLHYYDYVQMNNPEAFDENGRPTYDERFPTAFGDGVTGWGTQMVIPHETEQLRNSRLGAANFVAKRGGKKTLKRKNRKSNKTRKHKKRRGRK